MTNTSSLLPFTKPAEMGGHNWRIIGSNRSRRSLITNLTAILEGFQPISLNEMDSVALLNRVDHKYVLSFATLQHTLLALKTEYRVLVVNGNPLNHYRTLYFDTPGFRLYNNHVNGLAERYKVRSREYLDTHLNYLEVKHKTRKDRTIKKRLLTQAPLRRVTSEAGKWLDQFIPWGNDYLEPKTWNTFTRITIVNLESCERVTIDVDIAFYNADHISLLEGVAVAEVKQNGHDHLSPFRRMMREQHIPTQSFSKYCVGTSLVFDSVKKNSIKKTLLQIKRISEGAQNE